MTADKDKEAIELLFRLNIFAPSTVESITKALMLEYSHPVNNTYTPAKINPKLFPRKYFKNP